MVFCGGGGGGGRESRDLTGITFFIIGEIFCYRGEGSGPLPDMLVRCT